MPSRNRVKTYVPESYYHVYNRGVNKRRVFVEAEDYTVFLNLLKRYLDKTPAKDPKGREYDHLYNDLELLAFCLMPNHFHLLVYQDEVSAITRLLRGVCTAYTTYFNKKYDRVGPLFQGVFKASRIANDAYIQHISRYIHMNPKAYKSWDYSSLKYYNGEKYADWVRPARILAMFDSLEQYKTFLKDYEQQRQILDELKHELANGAEL